MEDFPSLIKAPLSCKLPMSANEEDKYYFQKFIYTNEEDHESQLASHISYVLKNLGKALPIDHDWNRTDPGSTTKGSYWSDFLCWLKDTLILKGEEKASAKDFKMALYDLDEKFN
ncbi:2635_t:CDS:2 [Entrophospora sp. SA101]|nr:2635_t:CDS:2 [Entrophospora sp. SA101]